MAIRLKPPVARFMALPTICRGSSPRTIGKDIEV
uniref:Uncharacterized protein n=1 Tax=Arundo donax TaxID=35708 RepID=A0A0A9EHL9_ARUDO